MNFKYKTNQIGKPPTMGRDGSKGSTFCIMKNSLTAAIVSRKTGTQLFGGCSIAKVWQACENSEKEAKGLGACPQKKSSEVTPSRTPVNVYLHNRIYIFIMDRYAEGPSTKHIRRIFEILASLPFVCNIRFIYYPPVCACTFKFNPSRTRFQNSIVLNLVLTRFLTQIKKNQGCNFNILLEGVKGSYPAEMSCILR